MDFTAALELPKGTLSALSAKKPMKFPLYLLVSCSQTYPQLFPSFTEDW